MLGQNTSLGMWFQLGVQIYNYPGWSGTHSDLPVSARVIYMRHMPSSLSKPPSLKSSCIVLLTHLGVLWVQKRLAQLAYKGKTSQTNDIKTFCGCNASSLAINY